MLYETRTAPYEVKYHPLIPQEEIEFFYTNSEISNTQILGDLALKWTFIGAGMPNLAVAPGNVSAPMYAETLSATAAVAEADERIRKAR